MERWVVDISVWRPSPSHLSRAIAVLPPHEHPSITRYVKMEDRKRAFVSRLLQYAVVHLTFRIPFHHILILRTSEGKPYVSQPSNLNLNFNFNFSVTHHAHFVAIASQPFCLVGLDMLSLHALPPINNNITDFIHTFSSYFSPLEWSNITNAPTPDHSLRLLLAYWTLKESFLKAIGTGLAYPLNALEFHHTNWAHIYVNIHNKQASRCNFSHFQLKDGLFVSVARGSPCMATECYKKVVGHTNLDEADECKLWLNLPNPSFLWKTVEELMPNYLLLPQTNQT